MKNAREEIVYFVSTKIIHVLVVGFMVCILACLGYFYGQTTKAFNSLNDANGNGSVVVTAQNADVNLDYDFN